MVKIEVFISYSHKDEQLRNELEKHLSILKRQRLISTWHDRNISAGEEWKRQIDRHLDSAQIILLLVSADFLDSDYCYDIELTRAIERHDLGDARVIPIILRPVKWKGAPFGRLQALPTNAEPITSKKWESLDDAFVDVTNGLEKVINDIIKDAPKGPIPPPDSLKVKNSSADSIYKKIGNNINALWVLAQKNLKNIIIAYLLGLWLLFFYNLIYPDDIVDTKLLDWLSVFVIMLFPWGLLVAAISIKKIKKGFILGLIYPFSFLVFYFSFRYNKPDEVHCILWLFLVALLSTILYWQIRKDIPHLDD